MKALLSVCFPLILCLILAAAPVGPRNTAVTAASGAPGLLAPWVITTVDSVGDTGRYASLALHPQTGHAYVTYVKKPNDAIETAHYTPRAGNCSPNTDWTCNDSGFFSQGRYVSLEFALSGDCRRAYQSADARELRLNFFQGCFGQGGVSSDANIETVASGETGRYNSLKIDFAGTFHLAFQSVTSTSALQYAVPTNGPANCNFARCDVIDSGLQVGTGASLGLNGVGVARIAYRGGGGHLKYASNISGTAGNCGPNGTWQCDPIDGSAIVSQSISLYEPQCFLCSPGDVTRIAYYDLTSAYIKIAVFKGSGGNCGPVNTWQCDSIAGVGSVGVPGVSLAAYGDTPLIAYYDANDYVQSPHGVLKIARPAAALGLLNGNCGPGNPFGTWQCDTLDDGGFFSNSVGQYPSLAVNSAGLATIAYYDATDGKLKVAYQRFKTLLPLIAR
jgi:hypothetical protein